MGGAVARGLVKVGAAGRWALACSPTSCPQSSIRNHRRHRDTEVLREGHMWSVERRTAHREASVVYLVAALPYTVPATIPIRLGPACMMTIARVHLELATPHRSSCPRRCSSKPRQSATRPLTYVVRRIK